jgi:hypothetical protein
MALPVPSRSPAVTTIRRVPWIPRPTRHRTDVSDSHSVCPILPISVSDRAARGDGNIYDDKRPDHTEGAKAGMIDPTQVAKTWSTTIAGQTVAVHPGQIIRQTEYRIEHDEDSDTKAPQTVERCAPQVPRLSFQGLPDAHVSRKHQETPSY